MPKDLEYQLTSFEEFQFPENSGNRFRIVRTKALSIDEGSEAEQYKNEVFRLIEQDPEAGYCIDFTGLDILAADVLAGLIKISERYEELKGMPIAVSGLNLMIYEVFAMTRLNRVLRVYRSPDYFNENPLDPDPEVTHLKRTFRLKRVA